MLNYITKCMETYIFVLAFTVIGNCKSTDPCCDNGHVTLNETTMDLSHTTLVSRLHDRGASTITSTNVWYRYTTRGQGLLATSCPSGTQCGTSSPVWMSGTAPPYSGTENVTTVCIRNGNNCCARKGTMQIKNCNTFVVYKLVPVPPSSRYCFDSSSTALNVTSSTVTSSCTSESVTAEMTTENQPRTTENHPMTTEGSKTSAPLPPSSTRTTPLKSSAPLSPSSTRTTPLKSVLSPDASTGLGSGQIVGIAAGVGAGMAVIIVIIVVLKRQSLRNKTAPSDIIPEQLDTESRPRSNTGNPHEYSRVWHF